MKLLIDDIDIGVFIIIIFFFLSIREICGVVGEMISSD